jgi:hypothetical protein
MPRDEFNPEARECQITLQEKQLCVTHILKDAMDPAVSLSSLESL